MRVQPYTLSQRAARIHSQLPLTAFPRLVGLLARPEEQGAVRVDVDVEFGTDAEGTCTLRGTASVTCLVTCARCVEEVLYPLAANIDAALVQTDARAAELMRARDVMLVPQDDVDLGELIEDDLLLNLAGDRCLRPTPCVFAEALAADAPAVERGGAFAGLKDLLGKP